MPYKLGSGGVAGAVAGRGNGNEKVQNPHLRKQNLYLTMQQHQINYLLYHQMFLQHQQRVCQVQ